MRIEQGNAHDAWKPTHVGELEPQPEARNQEKFVLPRSMWDDYGAAPELKDGLQCRAC